MDARERIRMLDDAESCLRSAMDLIAVSVKGTECEPRSRGTLDAIENIIGSAEDGGSVSNMRKDIACASDPIWTKPLVSVKNADGMK